MDADKTKAKSYDEAVECVREGCMCVSRKAARGWYEKAADFLGWDKTYEIKDSFAKKDRLMYGGWIDEEEICGLDSVGAVVCAGVPANR